LDVNGLAGSIELYLGEDVLRRPDGDLIAVQWKGYVEAVGGYQGEIMGKSEIQTAFSRKIAAARSDPSSRLKQDWTGIDAILTLIFRAFT